MRKKPAPSLPSFSLAFSRPLSVSYLSGCLVSNTPSGCRLHLVFSARFRLYSFLALYRLFALLHFSITHNLLLFSLICCTFFPPSLSLSLAQLEKKSVRICCFFVQDEEEGWRVKVEPLRRRRLCLIDSFGPAFVCVSATALTPLTRHGRVSPVCGCLASLLFVSFTALPARPSNAPTADTASVAAAPLSSSPPSLHRSDVAALELDEDYARGHFRRCRPRPRPALPQLG